MKKLSLLFIALIAATGVFAVTNDLVIYSENGERFDVILDGVRQNMRPDNDHMVFNLRKPAYNVEVVFANPALGAVGKSIYLPDLSREYTYAVVHRKGQYRLRQVSNVPKMNHVPKHNPNFGHTHRPGTWKSNPTAMSRRPHPAHVEQRVNCYAPVAQRQLNHFMRRLDHMDFDRDRVALSRHFIANNCLTAHQVFQVLTRFDFESSKLQVAKFAYNHTVNPGNYYQVHDAFHFASTSRRLNNYIDNVEINRRDVVVRRF